MKRDQAAEARRVAPTREQMARRRFEMEPMADERGVIAVPWIDHQAGHRATRDLRAGRIGFDEHAAATTLHKLAWMAGQLPGSSRRPAGCGTDSDAIGPYDLYQDGVRAIGRDRALRQKVIAYAVHEEEAAVSKEMRKGLMRVAAWMSWGIPEEWLDRLDQF